MFSADVFSSTPFGDQASSEGVVGDSVYAQLPLMSSTIEFANVFGTINSTLPAATSMLSDVAVTANMSCTLYGVIAESYVEVTDPIDVKGVLPLIDASFTGGVYAAEPSLPSVTATLIGNVGPANVAINAEIPSMKVSASGHVATRSAISAEVGKISALLYGSVTQVATIQCRTAAIKSSIRGLQGVNGSLSSVLTKASFKSNGYRIQTAHIRVRSPRLRARLSNQ